MALHVSIDDAYDVTKLTSLSAVVKACAGLYTQDGQKITRKLAQAELKNGYLNVYEYDEDELDEAQASGSVIGIDWKLKVQTL